MRNPKLKGKKYINLVRCSTAGQTDTSIDDQLVLLTAFAREHEMMHVDDILLEGVSGSIPGNRTDINQLIARKQQQDDFDIVLVQDTTRLTRSGPKHGAKIEYDLEEAGIEVVFVTDYLPEGDYADIYKSILYFSGKQHAKSISMTSARGSMSSILQGRSAHCKRPPYGIDRLYIAPDGKPNHILRNLPDGTQLQLRPQTKEIIGRFGRNDIRGIPRHYIKQKDEKVVLVPGADDQVDVVRRIFSRHHIQGWGYYRIAQESNDQGIPSPSGKQWTVAVIRNILLNPIYTGLGIANRYTNAIYHMRNPEAPKPINTDTKILFNRRRPPTVIRPRNEWYQREEPKLADYLQPEVSQLATEKQQKRLADIATGRRPVVNKDRHRESLFILKGILTTKQGGYAMTGRYTGRKTSRKRYYAASKAYNAPTKDKILRKMIPAEPLEQAILGILQMVLTKDPYLKKRIKRAVQHHQKVDRRGSSELKKLWAEREKIAKKIEFIIDELDDLGRDAIKAKTDQLQAQLRGLDNRIRQSKRASKSPHVNLEEATDTIVSELNQLGDKVEKLPLNTLRQLLATMIHRAVVDLKTRQVELGISLPSWALDMSKPMCLDTTFACKYDNQAHLESAISLMKMKLMWLKPIGEFVGIDFADAA